MTSPAIDRIHAEIAANDVVVYMRGAPAYPLCGGSAVIVQILEHLNIKYRAVDVTTDSGLNTSLRIFADWPCLPQLYVKAEFIGGPEIVEEMYRTGEFQELMASYALLPA